MAPLPTRCPPKARTEAYRVALEGNPSLMRGARVLDVGCGTGILSMFAARGGAAAVVGLDGSERIAGFARQVGAWRVERGAPRTRTCRGVTRCASQLRVCLSHPQLYHALPGGSRVSAQQARTRYHSSPPPLPSRLPQIVEANGLSQAQGGPVAVVAGRVEQGPDIGVEQVGRGWGSVAGQALLGGVG